MNREEKRESPCSSDMLIQDIISKYFFTAGVPRNKYEQFVCSGIRVIRIDVNVRYLGVRAVGSRDRGLVTIA